jgi:hypothetical protein
MKAGPGGAAAGAVHRGAQAQPACGLSPAGGRPALQAGRGAGGLAGRVARRSPSGVHFALWVIRVCPADATLVRVDATMPEHRHGMNYRPSLKALGDGRWRAEGLMFHMAGRWELRLDVQRGGGTERLRESITLP